MDESKIKSFYILKVKVSAIDLHEACSLVEEAVFKKQKKYICVCPVSTIMECERDEKVLTSVNGADLVTPDGMPVVWLGRLHGHKHIRRVYGPELMSMICAISAKKGYRVYFYGATQNVLDKLRKNLTAKYPGLTVSGMFAPPFRQLSEDEDKKAVEEINRSNSDIIWVGLGSPKQDLWMRKHRQAINAPVMVGVGAAFDFLAGTKPQAPHWMRQSGLEWLFRLVTEPKRLWRRYLIDNFLFIYYLAIEAVFKSRKSLLNK